MSLGNSDKIDLSLTWTPAV